MATSGYRYSNTSPTQQDSNTSSSTSGTTTQQSTQTTNSRQSTSSSEKTTNMTPDALAALNELISQLMGGGTPEQRVQNAQREAEIQRTRGQQGAYTKDAAFADAQGAMSKTMRETLEKLMPSIVRAAEGAGASANSMRALLTQQAATQAAEASSALGLQAASNYGQINQGFAQVLEALTRPDNSVTEALINALNIAKGAVQTKTGSSTTTGSQTTNTTTNTQQNQDQEQAVQYTSPTINPVQTSYGSSAPATQQDQSYLADLSTQRALREMVQERNGWSSYGSF